MKVHKLCSSAMFAQARFENDSFCCLNDFQHPVTLNVATPKGSGWQFIEKASSAVTNGAKEAKKKLSFAQTCDVMQFFLNLMRHDNSTIYSHR